MELRSLADNRGTRFAQVLRHVMRRPLLVIALVAIAVLTIMLRNALPQPWDGLSYGFAIFSGMSAVSLSLSRSRASDERDSD